MIFENGEYHYNVFGRGCYFFDFLRLPRHCDDGKQDGDDGLLVHIFFDFSVNFWIASRTLDASLGQGALLLTMVPSGATST